MAKSKKTTDQRQVARAAARDRKRAAGKRMKVAGKNVFTLAKLINKSK